MQERSRAGGQKGRCVVEGVCLLLGKGRPMMMLWEQDKRDAGGPRTKTKGGKEKRGDTGEEEGAAAKREARQRERGPKLCEQRQKEGQQQKKTGKDKRPRTAGK